MNKLTKALLGTMLSVFSVSASAFTQVTAAQSFGGRFAYIGVRKKSQGHTEATALLELRAKDLVPKSVTLPKEIAGREIVAILGGKRSVALVTQMTNGGGDAPMVHLMSFKTGRWKKVGVVDCPSPKSVRAAGGSIVFECHSNDTKADSDGKDYEKSLKLGKGIELSGQKTSLPQYDMNLDGVETQAVRDGTVTVGFKMKPKDGPEKAIDLEALKF